MSSRRGKSRRWAQAQARDPWVRKARVRGLPARSAFKLEEVIERHRILRSGQTVLELGSAPGGWTRLVVEAIGPSGKVVGIDRLEMKPIAGAELIRADLTEPGVVGRLREALGGDADVVLCDIAPNLTGIRDVDAANQAELADLASACAAEVLKLGGTFLVKAFEGEGSMALRQRLKREYEAVRRLKPAASRDRSSEFYFLAQGLSNPDTGRE